MTTRKLKEVEDLEIRAYFSSAVNDFKIEGVSKTTVTKSQLRLVPLACLPNGAAPLELRPDDCGSVIYAKLDDEEPSRIWPVLSFGLTALLPDTLTIEQAMKQIQSMAVSIGNSIKARMLKIEEGSKIYVLRPMSVFLETCYFPEPLAYPDKVFVHVYTDAAIRSWKPLWDISEWGNGKEKIAEADKNVLTNNPS